MKDDAVAVEKESEAIKKRYTQIFKVCSGAARTGGN